MLALRKALDGVRRGPSAALETDEVALRAALTERNTAPTSWWMRAEAERAELESAGIGGTRSAFPDEIPDAPVANADDRDAEVLKGLERIADSIERIAVQLDSYHQERTEHLDAIEFLLREMLIGTVAPSTTRPIALGGVIDPDELDQDEREISLVGDDGALDVNAPVEVRSRFHDRWIGGFTISERVNAPGRRRYRLTRRSDGIPLPILFDACDVRAAEDAFSRQPRTFLSGGALDACVSDGVGCSSLRRLKRSARRLMRRSCRDRRRAMGAPTGCAL